MEIKFYLTPQLLRRLLLYFCTASPTGRIILVHERPTAFGATSPVLKIHRKKVTQAHNHDILHPFILINLGDKNNLENPIVPADVVPEVETWMS